MALLIISSKVRDYDTWRAIFDSRQSNRTGAGITNERVYTSADDKNEVVVILDARDTAAAKTFVADPNVKEGMKMSGVLGTPTFHFLEPT